MNTILLSLVPLLLSPVAAVEQENADSDSSSRPTVTIKGDEQRVFHSLQEAIDSAEPRSELLLSSGRFDERITINKSMTLVGATEGKTIIGPTEQSQLNKWNELEQAYAVVDDIIRTVEDEKPRRELTSNEQISIKAKCETIRLLETRCLKPVVKIKGTDGVAMNSVWVTMPLTPRAKSGLQVTSAVLVEDAQASLKKCAVVGCLSAGINVEGTSKLDVEACLVAACWGTGVTASQESVVELRNSDIRNNHHYNVKLASEGSLIQGCRISGTAWSGVVCGGRTIGNIIFNNSRGIYSAGANGTVKNNLIYSNGVGASNWSANSPVYEGNVFIDNEVLSVGANGPGEPKFPTESYLSIPPLGFDMAP